MVEFTRLNIALIPPDDVAEKAINSYNLIGQTWKV